MDLGSETLFMRVSGGSMAPRFVDGEFVHVDPAEPARDGRFVVVRNPGTRELTVRRLVVEDGRRVLRALAPGWPEWVLDAGNETMIRGVVVFKGAAWAETLRELDRARRGIGARYGIEGD